MGLLFDHLAIIHQQVTNCTLYLPEIWVPWYTISGNPEIKNMDFWVLDDAHARSWVNFIFWQPHLVSDIDMASSLFLQYVEMFLAPLVDEAQRPLPVWGTPTLCPIGIDRRVGFFHSEPRALPLRHNRPLTMPWCQNPLRILSILLWFQPSSAKGVMLSGRLCITKLFLVTIKGYLWCILPRLQFLLV